MRSPLIPWVSFVSCAGREKMMPRACAASGGKGRRDSAGEKKTISRNFHERLVKPKKEKKWMEENFGKGRGKKNGVWLIFGGQQRKKEAREESVGTRIK